MVSSERHFLATTALEAFWDVTKPIVFLGVQCQLYERRCFWEPLRGELLESPFPDVRQAYEAARYVDAIYERFLPLLADAMNEIHGTRYGVRYWRILIGRWFYCFIGGTYFNYKHLKATLQRYPDCTTVVLSSESFVTADHSGEYLAYMRSDPYQLQVYTKILSFLGKTFPSRPIGANGVLVARSVRPKASKGFIKKCISTMLSRILARWPCSTVLRDSYFPRKLEVRLMLSTLGRVVPILEQPAKPSSFCFDPALRARLQGIEPASEEFEACMLSLLPSEMPKCYLEGFKTVHEKAKHMYPKRVKAIFSSNAWHHDEFFQFWAATAAENGALLLAAQHGGNSGSSCLDALPSVKHENAIADRYYPWRHESATGHAAIVPMPAPVLIGRTEQGASNLKRGILWVPTQYERYLVQFPFLPAFALDYIAWQHRFAKALGKDLAGEVRVRHKPADYGWALARRLMDSFPDLSTDPADISFSRSLHNCRLYVCDHLFTTPIEALTVNKPTILFWDPKLTVLREEVRPYYDLLRASGILFDTPEEAAAAVAAAYPDVEAWWNTPARQAAVKEFSLHIAPASRKAYEQWAAEFKAISE